LCELAKALSPYGSALFSKAFQILTALAEVREEIEHLEGRAKAKIRLAKGDLWRFAIFSEIILTFNESDPGGGLDRQQRRWTFWSAGGVQASGAIYTAAASAKPFDFSALE